MSLSDNTTMLVQPYNGNNGGLFGNGNNDWWILLLFLWGGYGGYGGFGGGFGGGAGLQGIATRADINAGFQFQDIQNGIRGLERGLCDGFYNVNSSLMGGFNGVQQGLNAVQHQISDCCCTTQRAIDGVNYNMATNFCNLGNTFQNGVRDVIDNQNANYRGMMDFLVGEKLSAKDAQIAQLQNEVALSRQSALFDAKIDAAVAELIRRTGNDCPIPSYLVQPPTPVNFPVNGCGTVQFGGNCGRGCYGVAA
jgi:hypothetical protein